MKLAVLSAVTAGKGKIQGEDAFNILNEELKKAGYTGNKLTESDLPVTITIGDASFIIHQDGDLSEPTTIEKLKGGEPVQENTTLTDKNGLTITIPKNFKLSKESPTEVTKGMIIEDSENNQYVWIPVVEESETYTWE